jgi:hypothetical protein
MGLPGQDYRELSSHRSRCHFALVLCQTEFEVLRPGLSRPHRNHSRRKAGLKPHHFHRDEL